MAPACTCFAPTTTHASCPGGSTDTSPVKDRLKKLKELAFPSAVQFSACANTKQGMEKTEGKEVPILSEATLVPSGVVRLMELQEKGWSYIRP